MTIIGDLGKLPDHIADLVHEADQAGGAVLVFDGSDRMQVANATQGKLMPVLDYAQSGHTYGDFFWGAFNAGLYGNHAAAANPGAWLDMAVNARRISLRLDFINTYPWGRAACTNLQLDGGTTIQIRIPLEGSGIERYYGSAESGYGVIWALRMQQEVRALRGALDSLGLAVGLVDPGGALLHANASLRDMLSDQDGLDLTESQCLVATDVWDNISLRQALMHVGSGALPSTFVPLRRPHRVPLLMAVTAGAVNGTAVVTVARFGEDAPEIAASLQQAFGLRKAEAEVLAGIGQGVSVPDLAQRRGTQEGTIYAHIQRLKQAFEKAGFAAPSMSGLAALYQRVAAITRVPPARK